MSAGKIFAVFVIFIAATFGWFVLGGSIQYRTTESNTQGYAQVEGLWGEPQTQAAPEFKSGKKTLTAASSDVTAGLSLDQRRKGLLWYSTYAVDFSGIYGVRNDSTAAMPVTMRLMFPSPDGVYDGFAVSVDDEVVPVRYADGVAEAAFEVPAGKTVRVATGYRTQGQNEWRYAPTQGVGVVDDFTLTMNTDFENIDFPSDGVSPTNKTRNGAGWTLTWDYDSLVSGRAVAITMPTPINPGPVASRISFFAPVSLAFYFAAIVLVTAMRRLSFHPMNFAFLAGGFFAFHLLFAYLVDRVDLMVAFGIASAVSLLLCVGYLQMALADKRARLEAAIAQFVFLVLFSFSFFFEGFTGLAITIGAVLTLAYFMFRTGRIDWNEVFARGAQERQRRRLAAAGYTPHVRES